MEQIRMELYGFHSIPWLTTIFLPLWSRQDEELSLFCPIIFEDGMKSPFHYISLSFAPFRSAHFTISKHSLKHWCLTWFVGSIGIFDSFRYVPFHFIRFHSAPFLSINPNGAEWNLMEWSGINYIFRNFHCMSVRQFIPFLDSCGYWNQCHQIAKL